MNTQQRLDASMELLERSNEEFNPGGNTMIAAELLWGAYAQLSLAVAELRGWPASSHGAYRNTVTNLRDLQGSERWVSDWAAAERLHSHFYQDNLSPNELRTARRATAQGIVQLRQIINDEASQ